MEQTKRKFLKNMVGFSLTTWIGFAIGFLATPIATRLFVPEELVKVGLFSTYATLFASFCYLGLDQAYVRFFREPPGGVTRSGLLTFCTVTSVGVSVLVALGMTVWWQGLSAQVLGVPDAGVFICLCLYSVATVLFRYLSLNYRMEQNATLYTVQGVAQVLFTKVAYLAVGFGQAQARPAILTLTALMGGLTLVFAVLQRKRFARGFAREATRPFRREVWAFAAPLAPLTVITWLNASVSTLALRNLLSFEAAGIYSAALGLAATVNVIQTGFNAYWAPYVYEHYQQDDRSRFDTVHRLMACLLTGFGLTITLLQAVVFLLLGAKYRGSVVYFPFLFLAPICYCLSETTGMGIGIAKKSYWNTLLFLVSALVNLGFCYVLIPLWGGMGAAVAAAAAAVISLVLRTVIGERYYRAIASFRYVGYTVGLMLAASVGNALLDGIPGWKYAFLSALYALALWLFRAELRTLLRTAGQLLRAAKDTLKQRRSNTHEGERT